MPASCVSDEAMYDWQEPHGLAGTAMYLQECPSLKTFLGSNRKQRSNTFLEKNGGNDTLSKKSHDLVK